MQPRHRFPPQLLVSVRNSAEAESALAGGCDILDLKEPVHGSLGMPDAATVAAVVSYIEDSGSRVPISLALGEAIEWEAARSVPALSNRFTYRKLGTAGLGDQAGWFARVNETRRRFDAAGCPTKDGRGETGNDWRSPARNWIAVAYADWEGANGPGPEQVVEMASECGWAGVLVDTYFKENTGLLHCLSVDRLQSLARLARTRRLMLALAGKLQRGDIQQLLSISPDIVGIRSAACRAGVRTGEIDVEAVRSFRIALRATASTNCLDEAASAAS